MYKKNYNSIFSYLKKGFVFIIHLTTIVAMGSPASHLIIYPAPSGEKLSHTFKVKIQGNSVDVYLARVAAQEDTRRFKAVDDLMHSADYFDMASFCYFSTDRAQNVNIEFGGNIKSVKVLPSSFGVTAKIHSHSASFVILPNQNITVEINGDIVHSLHIFADPVERNIPKATDPNVIYFGPGIHEISNLIITDNKTVYIAGGAIIRAIVKPGEKYTTEPSGLRNYPPSFIIAGRNIKIRGQGIIDASMCPTHSRNLLIAFRSHNVSIEGIILRDPSCWTVPVVQSDSVSITNIKILGYRANSDGIDINNSKYVTIDNCFIRTNDDLVVLKTFENQGPESHVIVKRCILWNQLANALSIGAELRENIDDVLFTNCDIIHDTGREWSLRVFQCDSSTVKNITFENIRVEEANKFISLWIGKAGPSFEKKFGNIGNVAFSNITLSGNGSTIEVLGADKDHEVKNIRFDHVVIHNDRLFRSKINLNPFVQNLTVYP